MFCPKCAAQNIDDASFCRVCGANIGLVSQALRGRLPEVETPQVYLGRRGRALRRRYQEPPTLERGIVNVFMGLGFIFAALAVMWKFPGGIFWGWSFFFPGFSCLGRGIAAIVAAQKKQATLAAPLDRANALRPQPLYNAPPSISTGRNTGEMVSAAPSVTEGTTRHLGAEAPTRHFDS